MASTIVDRILAEYKTRKTTREGILRRKVGSPAEEQGGADGPSVPPEPAAGREVRGASAAGTDHFIARFKDELIPVIGSAVSSEISQALSRVRTDLVECLEKHFRRMSPPPRTPAVIPQHADSTETDLDLPADEVNRQLNRVFADMEPSGEGMAFAKTVIMPALDRFSTREEPGLVEPSGEPAVLVPEVAGLPRPRPDEPLVPKRDPEPAASAPPPRGPKPREIIFPHVPSKAPPAPAPRRETLAPPGPVSPFEETALAVEGPLEPASEAPEPPGTALSPEEPFFPPSPEPDASLFVQEIREALIPGIADGISHILEELESAQDRISRELSSLSSRVMGLEARSTRPPSAAPPAAEEGAGEPPSAPAKVAPEPPAAAMPELEKIPPSFVMVMPVTEEAPRPAEAPAAVPPSAAEGEPAPPRTGGAPELPAGTAGAAGEAPGREPPDLRTPEFQEAILEEMREMEKRLSRKIDSLKARKKKPASPPGAAPRGSGNLH